MSPPFSLQFCVSFPPHTFFFFFWKPSRTLGSHAVDTLARAAALLGGHRQRRAGGWEGRGTGWGPVGLPQRALTSAGGAAGFWVCTRGGLRHPRLLRAREHGDPLPYGPRVSLHHSAEPLSQRWDYRHLPTRVSYSQDVVFTVHHRGLVQLQR